MDLAAHNVFADCGACARPLKNAQHDGDPTMQKALGAPSTQALATTRNFVTARPSVAFRPDAAHVPLKCRRKPLAARAPLTCWPTWAKHGRNLPDSGNRGQIRQNVVNAMPSLARIRQNLANFGSTLARVRPFLSEVNPTWSKSSQSRNRPNLVNPKTLRKDRQVIRRVCHQMSWSMAVVLRRVRARKALSSVV